MEMAATCQLYYTTALLLLLSLHYSSISLHYTTLSYTPLHYTKLHYSTLHYIKHYITLGPARKPAEPARRPAVPAMKPAGHL